MRDVGIAPLAPIATRKRNGRYAPKNSSIRRPDRPGKRIQKRPQIGPEVRPIDHQVHARPIRKRRDHIVQADKGASGGRAVVVKHVRVRGITADRGRAGGDDAVLGRRLQRRGAAELRAAALARVVDDGRDDDGVVAGRLEQAVELADVGAGEAVVVADEDVDGGGGGGEEG